MAKTRDIDFSNLTELQKTALKRIGEYKKELAARGLYVRSAIELEFMAEDEHKRPIARRIYLPGLNQMLIDTLADGKKYLEKTGYEAIGGLGLPGRSQPMVPEQYEINIAEPADRKQGFNSAAFRPEAVAHVTHLLKKQALKDALLHTTCLTQISNDRAPYIEPNFSVRPYRGSEIAKKSNTKYENYGDLTSALHINVSLYDDKNRNVFGTDHDLLYRCAHALLEVQNEAAISMLPTEESLWRIHANNSTPNGIGISTGHNRYEDAKNNRGRLPISVRIVKAYGANHPQEVFDQTRIENRLPGVDADPFVSMAVSMAALVDAVRGRDRDGGKPCFAHKALEDRLLNEKLETVKATSYDLPNPKNDPRGHEKLIRQYERSKRMKELLGSELYGAILKEYKPEPARIH